MKIKTKLLIGAIFASTLFLSPSVGAVDVFDDHCDNKQNANSAVCANKNENLTGENGPLENIINTMLFIIGALSVIMLIYGGIRYTTSAGNANSVTAAKNTIMYAIVGLVVAFIAYAIVNWVVKIFN